jgi:hypothetical protein
MVVAAIVFTLVVVTLYGVFMAVSYYVMCVLMAISKMFETDLKTTVKWLVVFTLSLSMVSFLITVYLFGLPT